MAWAASNGDRSENADYKEGKRRLRQIDGRLRFLMNRLAHAEIVDPAEQTRRDRVFFGATVTYANERDEELTVTIVGVDEADMAAGKISIGSPVALALLRAKRGDQVVVRRRGGRRCWRSSTSCIRRTPPNPAAQGHHLHPDSVPQVMPGLWTTRNPSGKLSKSG